MPKGVVGIWFITGFRVLAQFDVEDVPPTDILTQGPSRVRREMEHHHSPLKSGKKKRRVG